MDTEEPIKRTRVRAYPQEFKACVVAQCGQASASVAKVALEQGLNANMIHTWHCQFAVPGQAQPSAAGEFLPLGLLIGSDPAPSALIRVEVRQGAKTITVTWPEPHSQRSTTRQMVWRSRRRPIVLL